MPGDRTGAQHAPKPRVHHFVQAPVKPLDQDGVVVGITGTLGWVIVAVALWFAQDRLAADGHLWWLWTGLAGTALGVVGTSYCWWRKTRRQRST